MSAKKEYTSPEAEVIRFIDADIITASGDDAGHSTATSSLEDTRLPRI